MTKTSICQNKAINTFGKISMP